MDTIKHVIGENTFEFENVSFSNSRTWGHKTELFMNDNLISTNKATYINRTWERYQYQSSMQSSVYKAIDNLKKDLFDSYKTKNSIKRLSQVKKEELNILFKQDNEGLFELLNKI